MNTQQLHEALNTTFDTFTGPPRAYIEIETGGPYDQRVRFVYATYKLVIEAHKDSAADYEGRLCDEMHKRFFAPLTVEDHEDRRATLIWRREPRYRCEPILEGFDEDSDEVETDRVRHSLSLRAYCPRVARFEEALT